MAPPPVLPPELCHASPATCAPHPVVPLRPSFETLAAETVARVVLDQACLNALDLDALAQRARPVRGKHPLARLPLYEPSVAEWQRACGDAGVPWPGAPASDLADSVRGVDRVVGGLRRLAEAGPDADLPVPPRAAFEAALKVHTRPDSEFRAGACHSYFDAWVRLTQATGCSGQFSEELSWLRHGVTFAMTHPNAPLKRAEPQHDQKVAVCQASMLAAGYSEAEFAQFCSRDMSRPVQAAGCCAVQPPA
jgi:hypothetical protein